MAAREDEQQEAAKGSPPDPSSAPLRGAALAARLLEDACAPGSGDPLRLEVVRTLARDLKRELESLPVLADEETVVVEGALRAADVANLAASSLAELSTEGATKAAAHLAAGAARALHALAEGMHAREEDHAAHALRDARSAGWRARLVAHQVDEFLEDAD